MKADEKSKNTAVPLSVVVFAYNEQESLPSMLMELTAWLKAHERAAEVLFVDDGSTDKTRDVARRLLDGTPHEILHHDRNLGIGAALKTGVSVAKGEWVTFLPADGQVPPEALGILHRAAEEKNADIVLSVYDRRNDGAHRKVLSWGVRVLILAIHGVRLHSEGPYLFRRPLFLPEELPSDTFFLNFEFPIRAIAAGLRVAQVTVPCRPRQAGFSKSTSLRRIAGVTADLYALRLRRVREGVARAFGGQAP